MEHLILASGDPQRRYFLVEAPRKIPGRPPSLYSGAISPSMNSQLIWPPSCTSSCLMLMIWSSRARNRSPNPVSAKKRLSLSGLEVLHGRLKKKAPVVRPGLQVVSNKGEWPSSLRKNLETEPLFSQVRGRWFWRWIELWSLRSAVDYAATSLGMRIRL